MSYFEWCDNIVKELLADEWYQKKSSKERILEQIKEFAEDLMYYYNHRERPEDIAGRWWAITLQNMDNQQLAGNENTMRYWTLQYGPWVEVVESKSLREQLREDIKTMEEKYEG